MISIDVQEGSGGVREEHVRRRYNQTILYARYNTINIIISIKRNSSAGTDVSTEPL
jgi:hypothetical protein